MDPRWTYLTKYCWIVVRRTILCAISDCLRGIKTTKKELNMSGNGGKLRITKVGTITGLYPDGDEPAEAWFDERCITNLLSFKELVKKHRITYDSDVCTSFTVHRSEYGLVDLHFRMHESGLHIMVKPDKMSGLVFIQTVEDNKKMYTTREVAGANRARELYEHLSPFGGAISGTAE